MMQKRIEILSTGKEPREIERHTARIATVKTPMVARKTTWSCLQQPFSSQFTMSSPFPLPFPCPATPNSTKPLPRLLRADTQAKTRTELREDLLGQGILLWNFWAIRLVRAWLDEFPLRGRYVEWRKRRTSFVLRVLRKGSMCRNTLKHENGMKTVDSKEFGVIQMKDSGLGFAPVKASTHGVATMSRHSDASRSEALRERVVCGLRGVSHGLCVVHMVSVYVVCSLTPSVDTSSVGSPRFCVSQARECSGLVPILGTDEVLEGRRVLNATVLSVAFMEPLFWVVICIRAACPVWGGHADVDSVKATGSYVAFKSRRRAIRVLEVSLVCSRCEDALWSGGNAEWISFFAFLVKVRESGRLLVRLLVPSCTVVKQGLLHHQQCNSLSLHTSGYAPVAAGDIEVAGRAAASTVLTRDGMYLSTCLKFPEPRASGKPVAVDRWLSSVDKWVCPIDSSTRPVDRGCEKPSSFPLALAPSPSPSHRPPRRVALQCLPSPLCHRVFGDDRLGGRALHFLFSQHLNTPQHLLSLSTGRSPFSPSHSVLPAFSLHHPLWHRVSRKRRPTASEQIDRHLRSSGRPHGEDSPQGLHALVQADSDNDDLGGGAGLLFAPTRQSAEPPSPFVPAPLASAAAHRLHRRVARQCTAALSPFTSVASATVAAIHRVSLNSRSRHLCRWPSPCCLPTHPIASATRPRRHAATPHRSPSTSAPALLQLPCSVKETGPSRQPSCPFKGDAKPPVAKRLHASRPFLPTDQQALPMAVDLFPENWATWELTPPCPTVIPSPRISFSCDLDSTDDDHAPRRSDNSLTVGGSPSSSEFDFCAARGRSEQESSAAADELFSDGVLLPLCLLYKGGSTPAAPARPDALPNRNTTPTTVTTSRGTSSSSSSTVVRSKSGGGGGGGGSGSSPMKCVFVPTTLKATNKKEKQKEAVPAPSNSGAVDDNPTAGKQSSSFWRFRRSISLNSGGSDEGEGEGEGAAAGGRRSSLICSFPLLSRSNSDGSNPVPVTAKPRQQHHLSATSTPPANALSGSSSGKLSRKGSANGGSGTRNLYYYGQQQHGGAGVRISPVLNVPSPHIPKGRSAGFLSLGHLLCSVKDKRRKKAQLRLPPSP
ncbi:hypothetical protein Taro_033943 [Colocasia esculenta]|uniref:Uncharacterized protein n=1 Tax=Colocasia esculenta TaxID=4460 RepID=A0A843W1H2_COLES|nr:hypothetical protein [Colocasia esculenta]